MKYLRLILLPFSWIYSLVMGFRRFFYKKGILSSYQAALPVVSIGNLSTGGTGKTPFAEYLMDFFYKQGRHPVYLSRGYGRELKGCLKLDPATVDPRLHGDEATQVCLKFPALQVWVSESREEGMRQIVADGKADLLILDDAFQHLKVRRNLDLVMIDAQRLPTSDFVLPAGNLRESRTALKAADFFIINKINDPKQVSKAKLALRPYGKEMAFCRPVFQAPKPFLSGGGCPQNWQNLPIVLFSGIGNHAYFREMVVEMGADLLFDQDFTDHYSFKMKDLQVLEARRRDWERQLGKEVWVLTTEKDRMRLWKKGLDFGERWIYFPIKLEWLEGKEAFLSLIEKIITDSQKY